MATEMNVRLAIERRAVDALMEEFHAMNGAELNRGGHSERFLRERVEAIVTKLIEDWH